MLRICALVVVTFLQAGSVDAAESRYAHSNVIRLLTGEHVVVAEGEFEPRSIGSYSLRVYSVSSPQFPYDDFRAGIIRPRNGVVERLERHDLDHDGIDEIIVVIRSAGTGGYLSADAFQYRNWQLRLLGSVEGLEKREDPVRALENAFRGYRQRSAGSR
jgi:hypothetical protein